MTLEQIQTANEAELINIISKLWGKPWTGRADRELAIYMLANYQRNPTTTYQSDLVAEVYDLDYCPRIEIEYFGKMWKEVTYDTPFGPRYSWHFDFKVKNISYHKAYTLEYVDITGLYKSNAAFRNEVDEHINKEFERWT